MANARHNDGTQHPRNDRPDNQSSQARPAGSNNADSTTNTSRIIKKYANRRLYDTQTSRYINLEDLAAFVRRNIDFSVVDAKTGEDLTRSTLTHVILGQEASHPSPLPTDFLRQLIGFYGDNMQTVLSRYLQDAMSHFVQHQQQMQSYITPFTPPNVSKMQQTQAAMAHQAMAAFFPKNPPDSQDNDAKKRPLSAKDHAQQLEEKIATLQDELQILRKNYR